MPAFLRFAGDTTLISSLRAPEFDPLGIHCYFPSSLQDCDAYFNPPHVDTCLFTALFQPPGDGNGLLEVADLDSTEETGSEAIGETAEFKAVYFEPGQAVLLAGTQARRILNARACVHRVKKSDSLSRAPRLSLAVFCRLQEQAGLTQRPV